MFKNYLTITYRKLIRKGEDNRNLEPLALTWKMVMLAMLFAIPLTWI
ncbi:hypothetical protein [Tunicatimonas pelagia]|nr:hypothetical protein [Tunicatimonas pelagia]WKN43718.1 hypothetical protein P0M28_01875 [Tunicatimonas pelagia]